MRKRKEGLGMLVALAGLLIGGVCGSVVDAALIDNEIVLAEHDGPFYGGGFNNDDRVSFHKYLSGVYSDMGLITGVSDGGWQISGLSVGDINNDGSNEVALSFQYNNGTGAGIGVYNYTNGVWSQLWLNLGLSSGGWGVQGVGIGNADNSLDGSNELVLGWHYGDRYSHESDVVVGYRFTGSGISELFRGPGDWTGGWNITGVGVGDADNDGDNEVVLSWSYYTYGTTTNEADTLHVMDFTGGVYTNVRWDIRLDSGDPWDTTGLDIGDADNDGVNEIAVSWRKFGPTEQGAKLTLYNYAGGGVTLKSTPFLDATSNWGIHGVGIGNADNVIPEPATIGLLLIGGLLIRRKR